MATALTLKQAIAAVWQKFMGVIGYTDISDIGDGTVKGAIARLNGKLSNLILGVKYLNVTTDQYGKVNLPIETLAVSVYPNSAQYGIFQYANNSIRIFDIGSGTLSFAANKKIDIYIIYASVANLE